jgi:hypothetical protein
MPFENFLDLEGTTQSEGESVSRWISVANTLSPNTDTSESRIGKDEVILLNDFLGVAWENRYEQLLRILSSQHNHCLF